MTSLEALSDKNHLLNKIFIPISVRPKPVELHYILITQTFLMACIHLEASYTVSSGVSFSTAHLMTISSTMVSSETIVINFAFITPLWISPASFTRPIFFPKQNRYCLNFGSSENSPAIAFMTVASSIPVSAEHSLCMACFSSSVKLC